MQEQGDSARVWSSPLASHLAVVGAAVGLGSIWRFPYLVGAYGGGAFVVVFIGACLAVTTPLLVAEFIIGRATRKSPPDAAGVFAGDARGGSRWNAIGILGTLAAFLINSFYAVIAGWVLRYLWLCGSGALSSASRVELDTLLRSFLADPIKMDEWHSAFLVCMAAISAGGLKRGIEIANRIRAPAFILLLLALVVDALSFGDAARGLRFALWPDWTRFSGAGVLAAIGQSFFATGVGMAMMIAYGAYIPKRVSLVRSALAISGSIVGVSLLATLLVFPLVFRYGINPAQGPELVFVVLPNLFAEMPVGRVIGTLFFLLLALAALTPAIANMEPTVSWLERRGGLSRVGSVGVTIAATWFVGLASILSFNAWSGWHPFAWLPRARDMTFYSIVDFLTANVMLPAGALLTSVLVGWVAAASREREVDQEPLILRRILWVLLRYVCPVAIVAVAAAALF